MMRVVLPLATALLLSVPALAQTTTTTPAPATSAPATAAPSTSTAPTTTMKKHAHRQTLQQRFDAANTTHDGKLTKDQAAAANWPYVVNNFAAIDKDKRGYVTTDDIRAYARARHAAKHQQKPSNG
ncbi:MAG: EF-hand domain-containing protein [Alphaproteobacteria bacterium]|nr:EF-hand domain-containing protein [Alphaproteobacteria bacterium]